MDSLQRAINESETIRCLATITTASTREACQRQEIRGVEAVVLARAMTCGALLATLAKEDRERVRIVLQGGGPTGQVIVDAHGDGRVRACTQARVPEQHPALSTGEHLGRIVTGLAVGGLGHVVVTRDLGMARPYQGTVPMTSGEVDEDLQHYLNHSEQLPSALSAAVVLDQHGGILRSAGILCQGFPGSDPSVIGTIAERFSGGALRNLMRIERTTGDLIDFALADDSGEGAWRDMGHREVRFHCECGPENARRVLSTLGHDDLLALADEREQTEVTCHFCGSETKLQAAEIRDLARQLRRSVS